VNKTNEQCQKRADNLSEAITDMESSRSNKFFKIDQLEQFGRRLNLEFEGIPQVKNENVTDIVVKLTKQLNVDIKTSDISIAHRLLPKRNRSKNGTLLPPTIIAQFTNKRVKNDNYTNSPKPKI